MELNDKTRIFLNTAIITASTILEKILFFLINIIVARYLGLVEYGEYTTALAFATFFSLITDIGINQTMIMELNYEGEQEKTFFNIVCFKVFFSVIIFSIFLISVSLTGYRDDIIYLVIIFGFVRFLDEYMRLYYVYYEATDKYLLSASYRLFFALFFLASVFAIIYIDGGNREIALSRLIVVLVFFIIISYRILRGRIKKIDLSYLKNFRKKLKPFASAFISNNIIYQGNLIILPLLHGAVYTGIFQNAYMFITTLMFIPGSFDRVFIPYLYQQSRDENNVEKFQFAFKVITKAYVFISFYITTVLFLYSDFVIITIFGEKFKDSIVILRILSLAFPFVFNAANIMLTSLNKQNIVSRMLKYIAALNIFFNILLGYYFQVPGTAAATVLTLFFIFIISNVAIKKYTGLSIGHSIISYMKGFFIFGICWLLHELIKIDLNAAAIFTTTLIFVFLNFMFFVTKDDFRIVFEMLGVEKKI